MTEQENLKNIVGVSLVRIDGDAITPQATENEGQYFDCAVHGYKVIKEVDIPPYNALIETHYMGIENTSPLTLLAELRKIK